MRALLLHVGVLAHQRRVVTLAAIGELIAKPGFESGGGFVDIHSLSRQKPSSSRREDYVYLVPFVEDEHTVFLKTIIPSRRVTKQYRGEESDDHED